VTLEIITDHKKHPDFDLKAFLARHSKDIRYPEILACTQALKQDLGFRKIGALGSVGADGVFSDSELEVMNLHHEARFIDLRARD